MKRSSWLVFAITVGVVLLGVIIHNARYGAVSPRIRNPNDTGGPHPLSDPLFGSHRTKSNPGLWMTSAS